MKILSLYTLLFTCLLAVNTAWAQSLKPCFKIEIDKGCAPFKARVIDCSGAPANLILYDFGKGAQTSNEFTFATPGKYPIIQLINTGGTGGAQSDGSQFVEVFTDKAPIFEAAYCEGGIVDITVKDNTFAEYEVDFGNGTKKNIKATETARGTYTSDKMHLVVVRAMLGTTASNCSSTGVAVNPILQYGKAELGEVRVLDDGRVKLTFELPSNTIYRLSQTSTSGTTKTVDLLPSQKEYTTTEKVTAFEGFLFRINKVNLCTNREGINEELVATTTLTAQSIEGKVTLGWQLLGHRGFISYDIYRNNTLIKTITNEQTTIYEDPDAPCGIQNCYRLEAKLYDGTVKSIAAERCVVVARSSDLVPIENFVATVADGKAKLTWKAPTGRVKTTIIYRFTSIGTTTRTVIPVETSEYIDPATDPRNTAYCYKLTYTDFCGNESQETPVFCLMFCRISKTADDVLLAWNRPTINDYDFFVERLDPNGDIEFTSSAQSDPSFSEAQEDLSRQINSYRVRAVDKKNPSIVLYSNTVRIRLDASLSYPNAFSPNDDGLNDVFTTSGKFIDKFSLKVYNRWGVLVYSTDNIDGVWEGSSLPIGSYAFSIDAEDTTGKALKERGLITIVK